MPEKMVTLTCENCNEKFKRRLTEHKRNQKRGRHVFCNLSCAAFWLNKHSNRTLHCTDNLIPGNRDEYTPFRYFHRVPKRRRHKYELDLPYIKALWEEQDGQCPLTGWHLHLPPNSDGCRDRRPDNASLDRIDNNLGYVRGNVRFVALMANLARNIWDDEALMAFAHAVVRWGARD